MKKLFTAVLSAAILAVGISAALPTQSHPQLASASQASDKYDGDCTGHETAGRCADKCPANPSNGTYHLQGYDKDTGAAVCRLEFYHACPYADAVEASDPLCDKLQAEQQAAVEPPAQSPTDPNYFGGK